MTTIDRQDIQRAWSMVGDALAEGFREPPWMTVTQWADSSRILRRYAGAAEERFRTRNRPYMVCIQNAPHEAGVVFVAVMAAEQMAKSEAMLNVLGHAIAMEPGPVLVIYPTDQLAKDAGKKRITPMVQSVPALRKRLLSRKYATTSRVLMFDHMSLTYAGSEADNATETYAYRKVLIDELDRCKLGTVEKVQGRTTVFSDTSRLVMAISTPEHEAQGIHREFLLGDQRRYWVPCPYCGEYHLREFDGVEWPGMNDTKPRPALEILNQSLFRCPNPDCRQEIHAHHNEWQLLRGVWAPGGLRPARDAAPWALALQDDPTRWHAGWIRELRERELLTGEPTATIAGDGGPGSGGDRASFAIDGLLNPEMPNPYGQLAKEYVDAGGNRTRHFVTRRLGRPFARNKIVEPSSLRAACVPPAQGGYLSWRVPAECQLLVTTADVQKDACFHMTAAISDRGRLVHVIGVGRVDRTRKDFLEKLWPAVAVSHPVIDTGSGELLGRRCPVVIGVDSGYDPTEVETAVADRSIEGWTSVDGQLVGCVRAMKGHGMKRARTGELRFVTRASLLKDLPTTPSGQPRHGFRIDFASDKFSQEVQDLVESINPDRLAAAPGPVRLCLPFDAPDSLFDHLTSERLVEDPKRGGTLAWRVVDGKPNHWRDCLKMALALANHFGLDKLGPYRFTPPPPAPPSVARPLRDEDEEDRPRGWLREMLDD